MSRVNSRVASRKRRKKILDRASGYAGSDGYRQLKQIVERGLQYAYRDRRVRKREMRSLWIVRLNAALRALGLKYSSFIGALIKSDIQVNRKMLADMAVNNKEAFVQLTKKVLASKGQE